MQKMQCCGAGGAEIITWSQTRSRNDFFFFIFTVVSFENATMKKNL